MSIYGSIRKHSEESDELIQYFQELFVCLILFFTSTQQSFSYAGRVFLG